MDFYITKDEIVKSYLYENSTGIDPYYYGKFSLKQIKIENFLDSSWTKSSIKVQQFNNHNTPVWYQPVIDSNSIIFINKFD